MNVYHWNSMNAEPMNARVTRKVIHGANLTIARLEMQKYASVPEHSHVNEQIATVERGAIRFIVEGKEVILRAGESLAIPPNVPHSAEALEDTIVVDVFSPARADWLRGDDAYLRK